MTVDEIKSVFGKMPARIKELWVQALRSGEYTQICGKMRVTSRMTAATRERHGEGHCCLGVLTEIAKKEGVLDQFKVNPRGEKLTTEVRQWAGLNNRAVTTLITQNDGRHGHHSLGQSFYLKKNRVDNKSFQEIADWVEGNV